jgi:tetratricopeptide (TPR) repeat protein
MNKKTFKTILNAVVMCSIIQLFNCTPIPLGYHEWVGQHRTRYDEIENELKTDSLNYKLLTEQGDILNKVAMFNKALPKLRKSIVINQNYKEAYITIGNTFRGLRNIDSSFKAFKSALKIDPEYGLAYFNLGTLYWRTGEKRKAIEFTEKAIELDKAMNQGYYNLACFYSLENDNTKAIKNLRDGVNNGFRDCMTLMNDKDLTNIRNESEFEEILTELGCR